MLARCWLPCALSLYCVEQCRVFVCVWCAVFVLVVRKQFTKSFVSKSFNWCARGRFDGFSSTLITVFFLLLRSVPSVACQFSIFLLSIRFHFFVVTSWKVYVMILIVAFLRCYCCSNRFRMVALNSRSYSYRACWRILPFALSLSSRLDFFFVIRFHYWLNGVRFVSKESRAKTCTWHFYTQNETDFNEISPGARKW